MDAAVGPSKTALTVRRPHFRRVGNELFFLISNRPYARLSESEVSVWTALEAEPSVDELRHRFAFADDTLRRFGELGVCEFVETCYPGQRRRVLVLEPHSDDAVLSVGGTMWQRRQECEFIVVTVGSRSNFTSYYELDRDYFDIDTVTALRNTEAAQFVRLLGGQHYSLGLPEAALRYQDGTWSLGWFRKNKAAISAFIAHHSGPQELEHWGAAIHSLLKETLFDELWFPLGGPHTDHQLVRDACLTLMVSEPSLFRDRKVCLYQDVPYSARTPTFTPNVVTALTEAGAILADEVVPIESVFAEKQHLVSIYGSQFKLDAIAPDVEKSARLATGGGGLAERFWRIERPPTMVNSNMTRFDAPAVQQAASRLAPWLARHHDAERLRLLLLVPAGRWDDDMGYLLEVFPKTHFDVYVATEAETTKRQDPRIHVHNVGGGAKAWGLLGLRLALARPTPTIFLAGEKRQRHARLLSTLWPLSDPLVLVAMDQLVSALMHIRSGRLSFGKASKGQHPGMAA